MKLGYLYIRHDVSNVAQCRFVATLETGDDAPLRVRECACPPPRNGDHHVIGRAAMARLAFQLLVERGWRRAPVYDMGSGTVADPYGGGVCAFTNGE